MFIKRRVETNESNLKSKKKMIKKFIIVTTGRSDYGMLKKLANELEKDKKKKIVIVATGTHLSRKHGYTIKEINKDKFKNILKINLNIKDDTKKNTASAISNGIKKFYKILSNTNPFLVILLGDRYETFSFSIAANIFGVPIIHLHGGEVTSGSMDDTFRHCITKMSDIHFVANKVYKNRVIQLGENPNKVFNVGGLSLDNISKKFLYNKNEIQRKLKLKFLKKNLIITFHPETINNSHNEKNLSILLNSLSLLRDTLLIFTIPNADFGNYRIIEKINFFSKNRKNVKIFNSLGHIMYLSLVNQVDGVIGNSSSGLSEVPILKKGSINIGKRQEGRLKPQSVISCKFNKEEINKSIKKLYNKKFQAIVKKTKSPYGKKGATKKILKILNKIDFKNIKYKKFFDIK